MKKHKWYDYIVIALTWGVVCILWIIILILMFTLFPLWMFELLGGGC